MRKCIPMVILMFLFLSSELFIACSDGGGKASKTSSTEDTDSTGLSWKDVPLYPKSNKLQKDTVMVNKMIEKSHTEKGEIRFFEADGSSDSVVSFYKNELPNYGWEKIMGMKMGTESYVMTWHKKLKDEDKGITFNITQSPGDGKVRYSIIMGQGKK